MKRSNSCYISGIHIASVFTTEHRRAKQFFFLSNIHSSSSITIIRVASSRNFDRFLMDEIYTTLTCHGPVICVVGRGDFSTYAFIIYCWLWFNICLPIRAMKECLSKPARQDVFFEFHYRLVLTQMFIHLSGCMTRHRHMLWIL